jgi:outer membrane protein assembly factor BamB
MTFFKTKNFMLIVIAVCLFLAPTQQTCIAGPRPKYLIKNRQRVDLRNLGYPLVNEIPANSCYITSLLTAKNGIIYGATSGEQAYLFMFDPKMNKIRHLGKIAGATGVHHSLTEDKDGNLYIGTGKNILDEFELSKYGPRYDQKDLMNWPDVETDFKEHYSDHVLYEMKLSQGLMGYQYVDLILWNDIKNHFQDYPGGHLYRYNPKESNKIVKLTDMQCELEDLGIPVPKNSIYALAVSPNGDAIYGLTYPDGHFFIYDITAKKFTDLGPLDDEVTFHGPERNWRSLPRALVCDEDGKVYTSGNNGELVYYCPKSGKIEKTGLLIPTDEYRAHPYIDYAVVEYFAKDSSGLIYGGSCDGYLFSFDPKKKQLINLGKPRAARRIRCLGVAKDGKVYMMAGERKPNKPCQLYTYDPNTAGYKNIGILQVDRSPYYMHQGYQFDAMTLGNDGTIFFGESDRRGTLFMYIPE